MIDQSRTGVAPAQVGKGARRRVACIANGPDEYAAATVRALAASADVLVIGADAWVARYEGDLPRAVTRAAVPWPRHRDPRGLVLAWRVVRRLGTFDPDVVHFLGDNVFWLLLALPWLRRWPLVVTVHDVVYHPGDNQSSRVPMATVRRLRQAATAAIVHGRGLAAQLASTGVRPAAGIHVLPHLLLDRLARRERPAEPCSAGPAASGSTLRLLFFGRVMAYKGLGVLVEALGLIDRATTPVSLVVAGTGPELERLRPALAGLPDATVVEGYVPDCRVAGLFAAADVVALPYVEASQSGVAALAAAFGKPLLATSVGDLGQLVTASGMGLVVPPGDARGLAEAIVRLAGEPGLRAELAAGARAAAAGFMSPGAVVLRTLEIYDECLACRRR